MVFLLVKKTREVHKRAPDNIRQTGRFQVETSIPTLVYLFSVRPVYLNNDSDDLDCLNDAKVCLDLRQIYEKIPFN